LLASNIGGSSSRYSVDNEDDGTTFHTQSMSRVAWHDCQLVRLQGDRTAILDVEKSRPFEAAEQLVAIGMGMEIRSLVRDDTEADVQSIDRGEFDVLPSLTHCIGERLKIVLLSIYASKLTPPEARTGLLIWTTNPPLDEAALWRLPDGHPRIPLSISVRAKKGFG
jgi:hypothetical protein